MFGLITLQNFQIPVKIIIVSPSMADRANSNTNFNNDVALRTCLVWLAVVMAVVGIWTHSFKKVFVTYLLGMFGISGVLLPDWDFFARDYSRWCSPMTEEEKAALSLRSGFRKKISPLKVAIYSVIYGYGLYKWWRYVST